MKIFLVGMPGSGKSVLGKELAAMLNLPFIDLDEELEKQEGAKISEIFSEKGEYYFREIEAEVLRTLSNNQKEFVMATGGGAPCFHNTMEFINQTGISIFLNTPVQTIVNRIDSEDKKTRPLLADSPDNQLTHKLEELFHSRIKFYKQAQFTLNSENAKAKDVLQFLK